ncbi:hypothetical protein NDU88_000566 [Pleurodeles waltl]|uniref:Uncharacterized protein n=1 Tax=Pleurodeles waltl TaxID=8319 RepID=A0AAV7P175_PLEWA|nr:hypothetical protein NDU88_000566 [Pleurodeles waltl]
MDIMRKAERNAGEGEKMGEDEVKRPNVDKDVEKMPKGRRGGEKIRRKGGKEGKRRRGGENQTGTGGECDRKRRRRCTRFGRKHSKEVGSVSRREEERSKRGRSRRVPCKKQPNRGIMRLPEAEPRPLPRPRRDVAIPGAFYYIPLVKMMTRWQLKQTIRGLTMAPDLWPLLGKMESNIRLIMK